MTGARDYRLAVLAAITVGARIGPDRPAPVVPAPDTLAARFQTTQRRRQRRRSARRARRAA